MLLSNFLSQSNMKKAIFGLSVALLALTSCEDAIDLKPQDRVDMDSYFQTSADLEMFSNPFYNNLLDKEPEREKSDFYLTQTLSDVMLGGTKRTTPASAGSGGWSWGNLRRINTLWQYADRCPDTDAVAKYKGVTAFFRALFYFEKVERFGDVPWYDHEIGSADEDLYKPRDSRELVMSNVVADLDFAIANCPDKAKEPNNPFRITKGAALALKARVCLFEGTFRKYHNISLEGHDYMWYLSQAAEAAETLMNRSEYKLYSTGKPEEDYLNLFTFEDANTDEYILAIRFTGATGAYHEAASSTLQPTGGTPGFPRKLVYQYLMKDGSRYTDIAGYDKKSFVDLVKDRDPRLAQSIRTTGYHRIGKTEILAPDFTATTTGFQPIKFVQSPLLESGQLDNKRSTCDMPVLRYGEVLLNFAEAKAEAGTLTQADLDKSINLLRARAGMPSMNMSSANANPDPFLTDANYGYTNVTGPNQGVILEIRRERAVEFVMEGARLMDLLRWRAGYCLDQDIYGMYFPGPGEYDLTGDGKADVVLYTSSQAKPTVAAGVQVYKIGTDIYLSDGESGYTDYHRSQPRNGWNDARDYYSGLPINDLSLNPNLTQNPGWDDIERKN